MLKIRFCFLTLFFVFSGILFGCSEAYHSPGSSNSDGKFGKLEGNYASIEANIIRPMCISCHSGSDAPHGILLTSYESIMNSPVFPPLIIAGDPNKSSLYKSVLSGKMPKNRRRLTDAELKIIYDWIKDGALKEPSNGDEPKPCEDGMPCDEPCDDGEPCD